MQSNTQGQVQTIDEKHLQPAPQTEAQTFLAMITRAASDPSVDVNKMERLYDMYEKMEARRAEISFNEAMSAMSLDLPRVKKNGEVSYAEDKNVKGSPLKKAFNFATYEDIDRAIRPILNKHGFTISFTTEPRLGDGGGCIVVGTLAHIKGHKKISSISLALDSSGGKNNLQAMASTTSYGQRYTLKMLINLVFEGEDDDANISSQITTEQAVEIDIRARKMGGDYFKRFLEWAKVNTTKDIMAVNYKQVINALVAAEKAHAQKVKK